MGYTTFGVLYILCLCMSVATEHTAPINGIVKHPSNTSILILFKLKINFIIGWKILNTDTDPYATRLSLVFVFSFSFFL